MDFALSDDDPCPRGVFYSILGFTFLSADSADAPLLVVAHQGFDVLDFESLHVQIVQSQNGHRILDFEAKHECFQKVGRLLNGADVKGFIAGPQFHGSTLCIHPYLQFHMLNQSFENGIPVLFERSKPMSRHWYTPMLNLVSSEVFHLDFVEFDFFSFFVYSFKLIKLFLFASVQLHVFVHTFENVGCGLLVFLLGLLFGSVFHFGVDNQKI